MRHARRLFCSLFLSAGALAAQEGTPPHAATDAALQRLLGTWTMVGQVQGDSVRYTLRAARTVQRRYVELHMLDDASPPGYEARVLIGADTADGRVIVHWLDSFGAAYSVPAGAGTLRGDTLEFSFAYPAGTFRDRIIMDGDNAWRFVIEAQDGASWRTFADYRVTRSAARADVTGYDVEPGVASLVGLRSRLQEAAQRLVRADDALVGSERSVRVMVSLDAAGSVTAASITQSSGHAAADAEALRIVQATRFTPAQRGGATVPSTLVVPVRFVFPEH